jgi:hypothetical protein
MADVCEKHNLKLLTYGTLVRIFFFLLFQTILNSMIEVRWVSCRQMARPTRARSLFWDSIDSIPAEGAMAVSEAFLPS